MNVTAMTGLSTQKVTCAVRKVVDIVIYLIAT